MLHLQGEGRGSGGLWDMLGDRGRSNLPCLSRLGYTLRCFVETNNASDRECESCISIPSSRLCSVAIDLSHPRNLALKYARIEFNLPLPASPSPNSRPKHILSPCPPLPSLRVLLSLPSPPNTRHNRHDTPPPTPTHPPSRTQFQTFAIPPLLACELRM